MSFRWSFSQWENYNGCPARWNFKSVLKYPGSPPGPAAARGLDMHDRVERYIKGEIEAEECINGDPNVRFGSKKAAVINVKYLHVLDQFREHPNGDRYTEHKLGFDAEWYLSGAISKTAACIGLLDAVRYDGSILHVGEWKSGKPKDTHGDQRKIYALFGLRKWVDADQVEVTTYYLEDTAPPQKLTVKPTAEQKLKDLWNGRIEQMQKDKILAPKPSEACFWCDYAKKKGGPCQFGG